MSKFVPAVAVLVVFFALWGCIAHAQEKVAVYIYCDTRETAEAIGRIEQEKGHDAANDAASDALRNGDCFASADELPLHVVLRGTTFRRDGIILQVVGLSPQQSGEPVLWAVFAKRDDSA